MEKNAEKFKLNTPLAIIVAGIIIAGAVIFTGNGSSSRVADTGQPTQIPQPSDPTVINIQPVTSQDHIRGSIDAPVKLVEFSDLECPFCKRFHPTPQQIVDEYDGEVAWVYRHFPLDSLHQKARIEAAATELAAELGGNDAFWSYMERLFEITPSNDRLDLTLLPQIAEDIGLSRGPFEELVAEDDRRGGKFADHIESDYQDALASGGSGTPYSVVIAPNGKTFPVSGAQSFSSVKAIIEIALKEK